MSPRSNLSDRNTVARATAALASASHSALNGRTALLFYYARSALQVIIIGTFAGALRGCPRLLVAE
ncbi:hypothetical protein CR51_31245 [Caballeronia megalochromosomata]|nr:hypothetical protein CR51_31245 [Caballeronia megalochromosomata]